MVEIKFDLPYDKNSGWNLSLSGHGQNSSVSVKQNDWWCMKWYSGTADFKLYWKSECDIYKPW